MGEAVVRKVLIVDDDPDIVESLQMVMEKEGYAALTASNAEEGMDKVQAERPASSCWM